MQFNEETSAQGGGMERDGPARARRMPVSELAALLRNDAAAVARALLGEPNKQLSTRAKLRFGSKGSLEVVVSGPKRGVWHDRAADAGGDMLGLVQREQGSKAAGLEWARHRVGDYDSGIAPAARNVRPIADTAAQRASEEAEKAAKRAAAQRLLVDRT